MADEKYSFTFNFNAPVGQNIAHVDHLEAHFDKDMSMQVMDVEKPSKPVESASNNSTEKVRNAAFSKALDRLFETTDEKGDFIFEKKCHWQAVYRVACDMNFASNSDYDGFEKFINAISSNPYRVSFDRESLKKADYDIFTRPIKDWSSETYLRNDPHRKRAPFDKMLLIAQTFNEYLEENLENPN